MTETMAFLGCSKGLGRQVYLEMCERELVEKAILAARSKESLLGLQNQTSVHSDVLPIDFSKEQNLSILIDKLQQEQVTRIFYFAGGGPYGAFEDKQWKDHQWALQVSLLSPMKLLHEVLRNESLKCVEQFVVVGSLVADHQPDPFASSYAVAKHGLKGLVTSIVAEQKDLDVRLFRPTYIDTTMLPPQAKPRMQGDKILNVEDTARHFVDWAFDAKGLKILDVTI